MLTTILFLTRFGNPTLRATLNTSIISWFRSLRLGAKSSAPPWGALGFLKEIAEQLEVRDMAMSLDHVPMLQNEEADALTNNFTGHFTPGLEIAVDVSKLGFMVLHDLLEAGEIYYGEEFELAKLEAQAGEPAAAPTSKRKRNARLGNPR